MREILFRGKRIDNGEWVYGGISQCEKAGAWFITNMGKDHISYIGCHEEVATDTVGQFTGLTDKSGKKIFEGDIVKWGHLPGSEESPVRVASVEIKPDIQFNSNVGLFYFGSFAYQKTEKFLEKIGNIYDNPELLGDTA